MTARSIVRLLPRSARVAGAIRYQDTEILGADDATVRGIRRDKIGMIFQDPRAHINPVRTIGDFLTEGLRLHGVPALHARRRALESMDAVRIPDAKQRMRAFPHELSGGMLQRVMIASVLLAEPSLILADEPTTALDVTTQAEVLAILDELRTERDLAMILITHDLDLAAAICHRTAVMSQGTIVETGPSQTIQDNPQHPYTQRLVSDRPMLPTKEDARG
jgi:ABC-type dipeptide/oligopeptide/nickel transport system ATPase component